jgi:hypothetical protein
MGWFSKKPCAVCTAKDQHIASLNDQIADLRRLALPPSPETLLTPIARETNLILNPDTNHADISQVEYEAAALLSGNWDNYAVDVS